MSKSRLDILKEFFDACKGSSWHRVNLHLHASGQDPEMIVGAAIRVGITLAAITDHNTSKFVRSVQDEATRRTDSNLIVLPGISKSGV